MKKCAVIGSINMDMVVGTPRFPQPGESITGSVFRTVPGGKGANQAVALARLGVPVMMAGKIGSDAFGSQYMDNFAKNGVDASAVEIHDGATTGTADILVNDEGENCIVYIPGANSLCDMAWLDRTLEKVKDCEIILMQLEIPLETTFECIRRLRAMGKVIILDPAPAVPLPEEILGLVDYVTPNETELVILTPSLPEAASMEERIAHLIGDSDRVVIHKRGADGAYICTRDGVTHVPGFKVKAVDTTAAGDTFNAGLAAGLSMGLSLPETIRLANAAAALSVTAFGAQGGMPALAECSELLTRSN